MFNEVCVEIRTSWEKLSFPPVGVFLNRARAKKSCGFEQNGPRKVVVQDHLVEAARHQEEYLKMSHDEYMAVCLELMREEVLACRVVIIWSTNSYQPEAPRR